MRVTIIAVGKMKAGPERDLCARYLDRFARSCGALGMEFHKLVELPESRAGSSQARKRDEAASILRNLTDGAHLILLDERGKSPSSEEFSAVLGSERAAGRRELVLAIGGADGHDPSLRDRADQILSFGRMTWPHQMVRIMLAEQLYRATTILTGHPYHRS
jgi:23S rRNA (pseudouridine1915-N3)-methyltransferase